MKLQTRIYSIKTLAVLWPSEILSNDEDIKAIRAIATDEYARLKDGIIVTIDTLMEFQDLEEFDELHSVTKDMIKTVLLKGKEEKCDEVMFYC